MTKKKKKYTFRAFINDVHLWLGIASGIILFLVCLSGTILTFEKEIKSFFKEDFVVTAQAELLTVEELRDKLEKEGRVTRVLIPTTHTTPYQFTVKTSPKQRRGTTYYVNQYTGDYTADTKTAIDDFFMTMFKLHRWLLLDIPVGRPIVGIATIIFIILSISGIVLWFPKKLKWKNFKPGFKIKFSAKWKRINHDLHNTLGFYTCIFLLIMSLTGLCWSFEGYRNIASDVLGAKVFGNRGGGPKLTSNLKPHESPVSIATILDTINKEFPHQGKIYLSFPPNETGVYSVRKYNERGLSPVISDQLKLDLNAKVRSKEIFAEKPLNEKITALIKPLHMGDIFGLFSKTIYFIACLIATSLPVTGVIIWINKLKKKKKRKRKQ